MQIYLNYLTIILLLFKIKKHCCTHMQHHIDFYVFPHFHLLSPDNMSSRDIWSWQNFQRSSWVLGGFPVKSLGPNRILIWATTSGCNLQESHWVLAKFPLEPLGHDKIFSKVVGSWQDFQYRHYWPDATMMSTIWSVGHVLENDYKHHTDDSQKL